MQSIFIIATALVQFAIGTPIDAIGATESPGFLSGNVVQAPANIPINFCGNSVKVIGVLNPTFGNECENNSSNL
jgi:hypothetical protein